MIRTVPAASPLLLSSIRSSTIPWSTVVVAIYLAVALLFLARFFVGLAFGRRLLRASQRIHEARVTHRMASRAHSYGLALVPRVAESEFISVPVTMGALRSTILLPPNWREWDDAKLDAVVAHEVSHVARRDGLTQRLSLLHRAIFWFSPLAWWLDRHIADLAEQASDEAALSSGADCGDYARTLLGFFEALQTSPGRVWWQGVAMAKAGQAERSAEQRVERILAWKGSVAMGVMKSRLKKSIAVAVVVLAVPVVYLAASVRPTIYAAATSQHVHFAQDQSPASPSPADHAKGRAGHRAVAVASIGRGSSAGSARGVRSAFASGAGGCAGGDCRYGPWKNLWCASCYGAGSGGVRRDLPHPRTPAIAPVAPRAMAPPPAIWSGQSHGSGSSHGGGFSYHYGSDDDQRFVIVTGKTDSLTMSGSSEDAHHVEKLRKTIQGDFIWFSRDEKSYIIRDQATIDRARKFWAEEEELGKKQEALGAQQEALGKQQEELGAKDGTGARERSGPDGGARQVESENAKARPSGHHGADRRLAVGNRGPAEQDRRHSVPGWRAAREVG